jgi:hypothetical protein
LLTSSPVLISLDARGAFEMTIAEALANWQDEPFPARLADALSEVLGWQSIQRHGSAIASFVEAIGVRQLASALFQRLTAEAGRLRWWRVTAVNAMVAAVILYPERVWLRRYVVFSGSASALLKSTLETIFSQCPQFADLMLDGNHAARLSNELNSPRLTFGHVVVAVVVGIGTSFIVALILAQYWLDPGAPSHGQHQAW